MDQRTARLGVAPRPGAAPPNSGYSKSWALHDRSAKARSRVSDRNDSVGGRLRRVHDDDPPMTTAARLARRLAQSKTSAMGFWHIWTVVIPRLSVSGEIVRGRVWRRRDGRRWQYRAITEFGVDD
jgi:hypothetical protein